MSVISIVISIIHSQCGWVMGMSLQSAQLALCLTVELVLYNKHDYSYS